LLIATLTASTAGQQEKTQWLTRDEMIDAIVGFAASRCGKVEGLLAALTEPYCKDPTGGFAVHMFARVVLDGQSDEALRDLCRRHGIAECRTQEETPREQSFFVLDSTVALTGSPLRSAWSFDNRFLLFDTLGKTGLRVLDVASGQLVDKSLGKHAVLASAWSPDGRYVAVAFPGVTRILSVASWEEIGVVQATKDRCGRVGNSLAFTTDSRSLWITCTENDFRSRARIAIKVSLPELKIEDELLVSPPRGMARAGFWMNAITRHSDDLILAGYLYRLDQKGMPQGNTVLAALSLTTKGPVYPSFQASSHVIIRHTDDLSRVLLYSVRAVQNASSKGELPKEWKIETWDTRTGKPVGTFGGTTSAGSYMTLPVAIPRSNLLVAAVGARSSPRKTLMIVDDRTGSVLQEVGPVPTPVGIVPSPDGSRAAVFEFNAIRIYKVNRQG
jgi:hypothetical protein